jgi:hypothetical protein
MTKPEYLTGPEAGLVKNGEKEAVPQLRAASRIACISAASRIRGSFFGAFSAMARPRCGFPLLTWCRNGFHPPRPPVIHTASRSPTSAPLRA